MVDNLKNVTKYFKNQKPIDVNSLKTKKEKYTDYLFPPGDSSLFSLDSNGKYLDPNKGFIKHQDLMKNKDYKISWKRSSENQTIKDLYKSIVSYEQIEQGQLGDCYLIAAITSLSRYPNLVRQIFRTLKFSSVGYYELFMFIDGEWQIVILDDYFPYNQQNSKFIFATSSANLLWIMLIEKAWAKIHGGYSSIIGSYEHLNPFEVLTGFHSEYIPHEITISKVNKQKGFLDSVMQKNKISGTEVFNKIHKTMRKHGLVTMGTSASINNIKETGLAEAHAYCCLDTEILDDYNDNKIYLLKLHNPWGSNKYNGELGKYKNSAIKNYINYNKNSNDGSFYIDINSYMKYFDQETVCELYFDATVKNYKFDDELHFTYPLLFHLDVLEKSDFYFAVLFEKLRYMDIIEVHHPCYLILVKYDKGNYNLNYVLSKSRGNKDVRLNTTLDVGTYVVWLYVPFYFCEGIKKEDFYYNFSIASNAKYDFKLVDIDLEYKFIHELAYKYYILQKQNEVNLLKLSNSFNQVSDLDLIEGVYIHISKNFNDIRKITKFEITFNGHNYHILHPDKNTVTYNKEMFYGDYYVIVGIYNKDKSTSIGFSSSSWSLECKKKNENKEDNKLNFLKNIEIKNIKEDGLNLFIYKTPPVRKLEVNLNETINYQFKLSNIVSMNEDNSQMFLHNSIHNLNKKNNNHQDINSQFKNLHINDNNVNNNTHKQIKDDDYIDLEILQNLIQMGFDEGACIGVLLKNQNDLLKCIDELSLIIECPYCHSKVNGANPKCSWCGKDL